MISARVCNPSGPGIRSHMSPYRVDRPRRARVVLRVLLVAAALFGDAAGLSTRGAAVAGSFGGAVRIVEDGVSGGIWELGRDLRWISQVWPWALRPSEPNAGAKDAVSDAVSPTTHEGSFQGLKAAIFAEGQPATLQQASTTCLAVTGMFGGGLAQTISYVNTAFDLAEAVGARFVFPSIVVPGHFLNDTFSNIFGHDDVCPSQRVAVQQVFCDRTKRISAEDEGRKFSESLETERRYHGGCHPSQYVLSTHDAATNTLLNDTTYCGCERLLLLQTARMKYHFDYSRTYQQLAKRYWHSHPGKLTLPGTHLKTPGSRPRSLVLHVRLSDVENKSNSKHAPYIALQRILVSTMSALADGCVRGSIVTDGFANSSDIVNIIRGVESAGLPNLAVYDRTIDARTAFDIMTHADILLGGASGFPRLAAVLMRNTSARIFYECRHNRTNACGDHPLDFLPRTVLVDDDALDSPIDDSEALNAIVRPALAGMCD